MVNSFIELKLTAIGDAAKIVEFQHKLMTLYYDLKAIQQESQVTQNIYLLQKTVQKIPEEYQSRYAEVCMRKENQPGETQWKILSPQDQGGQARATLGLISGLTGSPWVRVHRAIN
jgi:hypothetical protein